MASRWLLPIIAVLALCGRAVTAFAAAGAFAEATCCCPDPTTCKCHDHDAPKPAAEIKRCAGEAKLVAPVLTVATVPAEIVTMPVRAAQVVEHAVMPLADDHHVELETPPF